MGNRPKRGSDVPEPMNVTLYGKGVFAEAIKLKGARWDLPGLPRWALNPITSVLTRDRRGQDTDTEKTRTANSCLQTERYGLSKLFKDRSYPQIGVLLPRAKGCLESPEAGGEERFCPDALGGSEALLACWPQNCALRNRERTNSCCKPPSCGNLLGQP